MKRLQKNLAIVLGTALLLPVVGWLHWRAVSQRLGQLDDLQSESQTIADQQANHNLMEAKNPQLLTQINSTFRRDAAEVLTKITEDLIDVAAKEYVITTDAASHADTIIRTPMKVTFNGSLQTVFEFLNRMHQGESITRFQRSRSPETLKP